MKIGVFVILGLLAFANFSCGKASSTCTTVTSSSAETTGSEVGINDTGISSGDVAQSFTVTSNSDITDAGLKLSKAGTIASGNTLTLTMEGNTTASGLNQPNGTAIATASVDVSLVSTTASMVSFKFSSTASLTAGQAYWLKLKGSYGQSGTDLVKWSAHDGSGGYDGGQALYLSGSTWSYLALGQLRDTVFSLSNCK